MLYTLYVVIYAFLPNNSLFMKHVHTISTYFSVAL